MNSDRFPNAAYANIFSYLRSKDLEGYEDMGERTLEHVQSIPGFCGYESIDAGNGRAIFISYWTSMEAIDAWRNNALHREAKASGKQWYTAYHNCTVKIENQTHHNTELL